MNLQSARSIEKTVFPTYHLWTIYDTPIAVSAPGAYVVCTIIITFAYNKVFHDKLSSGYFPGIRVLKTDISEHCIGSIFNRCCNVSED